MFRHLGRSRTHLHNLRLASLLSFVAGIVNVSGIFALDILTTNVTGHFGFFTDELVRGRSGVALYFLVFILAFLSGAFVSNFLLEWIPRFSLRYVTTLPVALEIVLLISVASLDEAQVSAHKELVAAVLLFAMGLQNALVTTVSRAIVRTTHLTGLFTDLGIELSQFFFYRQQHQRRKLLSSVGLRLTIICCFFAGGIGGGYGFLQFGMSILFLAVATLIIALVYDQVRMRLMLLRRRLTRS